MNLAWSDWVDLIYRYSNCEKQLGSLVDLLERIAAGDQTEHPGPDITGDGSTLTPGPARHKLSQRLSQEVITAIVESFQSGATIRAVAAQFDLSESSVKRILRRQGVRRAGPTP